MNPIEAGAERPPDDRADRTAHVAVAPLLRIEVVRELSVFVNERPALEPADSDQTIICARNRPPARRPGAVCRDIPLNGLPDALESDDRNARVFDDSRISKVAKESVLISRAQRPAALTGGNRRAESSLLQRFATAVGVRWSA